MCEVCQLITCTGDHFNAITCGPRTELEIIESMAGGREFDDAILHQRIGDLESENGQLLAELNDLRAQVGLEKRES